MNKNTKRIIIILAYLAIIAIFTLVMYFIFKPEPNCFDGVKNQGEEGIDCGGSCQKKCEKKINYQKLEVKSIEMADDGQGDKDVLIKIYNPNEEYGAKSFRFVIADDLKNRSQIYEDFILPKETKYIVINGYQLANGAGKIEVGIDNNNIEWKRAINYRDPKLIIYNERYKLEVSGGDYAKIVGLLMNKSSVDYETIRINGILRDNQGKFLGASYHIINTMPAGSKREFIIHFPNSPQAKVANIEVQAETNIFNNDNYLKKQGKGNFLDR